MLQVTRTSGKATRNESGVAGIGYACLDHGRMGNKGWPQVSLFYELGLKYVVYRHVELIIPLFKT